MIMAPGQILKKKLKGAFQLFDTPGDAPEEIKTLRMGNNSIKDHNAKFWMLLTKSGLNKTSPAIIDYYWETLNLHYRNNFLD